MKLETLLFDDVRQIIPEGSSRSVFYIGIADTSAEVFFYSWIDGRPVQCYTLAEEGSLNANVLEKVFLVVVNSIRQSKNYHAGEFNLFTLVLDDAGVKLEAEYGKEDVRLYSMKKAWKEKWVGD